MSRFRGTPRLILLALKRDRVQLPVWILAIAGLMALFPAIYNDMFATPEELHTATVFFGNNPAMRLFALPSGADLGPYTLLRSFVFMSIVVGLMNVLAVVRHTRQSEETRQAEMLGSTAVGRYALLTSALAVALLANLVLAVLIALALMSNGLAAQGSFAAGASFAGVGLSFAGLAALTAQISSSSRGASGMAVGGIGAAFLIAAAGSIMGSLREGGVVVDPAFPTWLSPIGWGQVMRPYLENNWWVLVLFVAAAAACTVLALALIDRRDVGRGILSEGRGPATAAQDLLSPVGLVWRLQRGVFLGWAAGVVAFGLVLGYIARDVESMMADLDAAEFLERVGGTDQMTDAYFVMAIGIMGTIIAVYAVQVLLRMRVEESDGPLESVLGAAIERKTWMASYLVNALAGTLALLFLLGASMGLTAGLALGAVPAWLFDLVVAAMVQAPATLVVAGVAVLAFAMVPRRAAGIAWVAFAVALLAGPLVGEMLELPEAVLNLSPFTHTPNLPAGSLDVVPLIVMLVLAAMMALAGIGWFRRRDLAL